MMNDDNNILLKNRFYLVMKDDIPFAYLSVKKDFYTEGYLIEQKAILVGYFKGYKTLDVHLFDSSFDSLKNSSNGLSLIPENTSEYLSISGEIVSQNYRLFEAYLDEYCDHLLGSEIECKIQIKKIEDNQVIQDINYLIRNTLRSLTDIQRRYYEMLKRHRYGNLKEALSGIRAISLNGVDLGMSDEVINDLEFYLQSLNPISNSSKTSESKTRNNKRKVKKKGSKKGK